MRIDETHAHDDVFRVLFLDATVLQAPTTRIATVSAYGREYPTSVLSRPGHESEECKLVQRHSRAHPTTARATVATRSLPARLLRSAPWIHGHRCRLCLIGSRTHIQRQRGSTSLVSRETLGVPTIPPQRLVSSLLRHSLRQEPGMVRHSGCGVSQ